MWPSDADSLVRTQHELAAATPPLWQPPDALTTGGCWVCFPRGLSGPGSAGDRAWSAAVLVRAGQVAHRSVVEGVAGAPYTPGLLALRLGRLFEAGFRGLPTVPDLLLVDATARDHPRRAGLALHLGAELGMPTIGVTHRPLYAEGAWPIDRRGATSPLRVGGEVVACWMRTRPGTRPLVVHPGWRVDLETAVEIISRATERRRTPEPLRQARRLAREARHVAESRDVARG